MTPTQENKPSAKVDGGAAPDRKRLRALAAMLAFAVIATHAPILSAGFVWDDKTLIPENAALADLSNIPRYFVTDLGRFNAYPRDMGFYRPLQSASFAIERAVFGLWPGGYHAVNLVLHLLTVLALFGLARRLLGSTLAGFAAAALFAVMPGKSEEVFLIANRGGVLASLLVMVSLLAHVRALEGERRFEAWSLVALAAGLLAKEIAIVAPALALLAFVVFYRDRWRDADSRERLRLLGAGHWAVAIGYLVWRFVVLGIHGISAGGPGFTVAALNVPRTLWTYLGLLIWPVGLTPEHRIAFALSFGDPSTVAAWVSLIALFAVSIAAIRRAPGLAFGLVFFALALAPLLNLVPLHRAFSEHYAYLPAAGVCVAIAAVWNLVAARSRVWRNAAVWAGLAVIGVYGCVNVDLAVVWHDDCSLWEHAYSAQPNSRAANNLARCFEARGETDRAAALFEEAVAKDRANYRAVLNLAIIRLRERRAGDALELLSRALAMKPDYDRAAAAFGVAAHDAGLSAGEAAERLRALGANVAAGMRGYQQAARAAAAMPSD